MISMLKNKLQSLDIFIVSDNARAEGKACGILLPDATLIPTLKEMGYTFVAVSSDVNVLTKHLKAIERALHG